MDYISTIRIVPL